MCRPCLSPSLTKRAASKRGQGNSLWHALRLAESVARHLANGASGFQFGAQIGRHGGLNRKDRSYRPKGGIGNPPRGAGVLVCRCLLGDRRSEAGRGGAGSTPRSPERGAYSCHWTAKDKQEACYVGSTFSARSRRSVGREGMVNAMCPPEAVLNTVLWGLLWKPVQSELVVTLVLRQGGGGEDEQVDFLGFRSCETKVGCKSQNSVYKTLR